MNEREKQQRMALMNDAVKFASTDASQRVIEIAAHNFELGAREAISVLIKTSETMLVSSLMAALDDDMPRDLAIKILRGMEERLNEYVPEKDDEEHQTAH